VVKGLRPKTKAANVLSEEEKYILYDDHLAYPKGGMER